MNITIGFYSAKKMYITFTPGVGDPYLRNKSNDLFLLSCLAIRQFQILDKHLVAKALAGILASDQIGEIAKDPVPSFPTSKETLTSLGKFVHDIYNDLVEKGSVEVAELESWLNEVYAGLNYPDHIHKAMDDMILTKVPKIVEHRRDAKRRFDISIPPFRMKLEGFGASGRFANHHVFYSVLMFSRLLYQQDPSLDYLEDMVAVLGYCARSYITDTIPSDMIGLANLIKKKIGY